MMDDAHRDRRRARHGVRLRPAGRSESAPAAGTMNPSLATPRDREEFFRAARAEASDQLLQELIQTVADKCFAKCITKPGSSLTGGESACLAKCMDRFLEARTLVVKALETQQ